MIEETLVRTSRGLGKLNPPIQEGQGNSMFVPHYIVLSVHDGRPNAILYGNRIKQDGKEGKITARANLTTLYERKDEYLSYYLREAIWVLDDTPYMGTATDTLTDYLWGLA